MCVCSVQEEEKNKTGQLDIVLIVTGHSLDLLSRSFNFQQMASASVPDPASTLQFCVSGKDLW